MVKDSRPAEEDTAVRRRRGCPQCGGRFTTFERVQLRDLTVIKRDGRRAVFERDKLSMYNPTTPSRGPRRGGDRRPGGFDRREPTDINAPAAAPANA